MEEIKSYKVSLFIIAILLLLAPVVYFIPENGFQIAGKKFSFLTKEEFFHPKEQVKKIYKEAQNCIDKNDNIKAISLYNTMFDILRNNRIDIVLNHIADVKAQVTPEGVRYLPAALANEWAGGRTWWRRAFTMILVYRAPTCLKDPQGMPYAENETHIIIQKSKPKGIGKVGKASIFWDWKKNRYYSFNGNQLLYSCENLESIKQEPLQPSTDFNEHPF